MTDIEKQIRDRLVEHGKALFEAPKELVQFTKNPAADALLNDIEHFPHAYVLACIMDRQITAERAWMIPFKISQALGGFSFDQLRNLQQSDFVHLMTHPVPLHRFAEKMGICQYFAVQRIDKQYGGDASSIWRGPIASAEIVYRFLEFDGVGPKIASMATNILAREFKVPLVDYYSVDISADVHVRRVFSRLGLCPPEASIEQIIYRARSLNPEFPGMMDLPCWEIGRSWCRPKEPNCVNCYMMDICPTAIGDLAE
jgi:endonuclease III